MLSLLYLRLALQLFHIYFGTVYCNVRWKLLFENGEVSKSYVKWNICIVMLCCVLWNTHQMLNYKTDFLSCKHENKLEQEQYTILHNKVNNDKLFGGNNFQIKHFINSQLRSITVVVKFKDYLPFLVYKTTRISNLQHRINSTVKVICASLVLSFALRRDIDFGF